MSAAKRQKRSASAEPARSPPMHDDDEELGDLAVLDEEETPNADKKPAYQGGFDSMKQFNGQYYTGMAIGGSHTWSYDSGIWKETKKEPDLWEIDYKVDKHRNHNAPKNSGAPVGTEYHWFVVAHQYVKKLDANTYSTHLTGSKYKLAHKNANSNSWSITKVKQQREREIFLLQDAIRRVEGLPPVLSTEKVKTKEVAKGQKTLDGLFKSSPKKEPTSSPVKASPPTGSKRKAA